ncbi:TerD family protein [Nocardia sp. SYP-A9097]|uniref:TerD family protein n=1 Tax=Nocardia sp. SYP-A9097 TaxID=2663237 RepID=UPI00129BFA92|nr:TerD family protein [Nocardia sp. SYP-A9097]MRH93395.1 TerD family protein [Nocardia sp. SYP-A9097]
MSIVLRDPRGVALECVAVALGWDPTEYDRRAGTDSADSTLADGDSFDLNVAALLFIQERLVDAVYHEQLISRDGSVRHTGDNLTGEGVGDSETIVLDLVRVAPEITTVIVVVTSYSGQSFAKIANAYCRLLDSGTATEITRCMLSGGPHTALVMGKLFRTPAGWEFDGIGAGIAALHPVEAVPQLTPYLL